MPRNCYLIADRGRNVLVHVDSGPTNAGKSAVHDGIIQDLVKQHGPIAVLFASQQQLLEIRTYAAHAALASPGTWLDPGENGYLTNHYLSELATAARAGTVCVLCDGRRRLVSRPSFVHVQSAQSRTDGAADRQLGAAATVERPVGPSRMRLSL